MSISDYSIVRLPFAGPPHDRTKDELKRFYRWYLEVSDERVAWLTRLVHSTHGLEDWQPDLSLKSLEALSDWFKTQIEIRARSNAELAVISKSTPWIASWSGTVLTDRTYSIAFDVGIYFTQVLLRHCPSLQLRQELRNRRDMNYGSPVVVATNPIPLNPMNPILSIARSVAAGHQVSGLRDAYEECLKFLVTGQK